MVSNWGLFYPLYPNYSPFTDWCVFRRVAGWVAGVGMMKLIVSQWNPKIHENSLRTKQPGNFQNTHISNVHCMVYMHLGSMLPYIAAPWILWVFKTYESWSFEKHPRLATATKKKNTTRKIGTAEVSIETYQHGICETRIS